MNGWLSPRPTAATDPTPAQMLKQLAAAIAKLDKATSALQAAADQLTKTARPGKSRLRRAVEIGAGVLIADGALNVLAGTVPLAGTALAAMQDAFTVVLGLGPVSALVDALLFAGYTAQRIQKTGQVPGWLTVAQSLAGSARRLWDRVLSGRGLVPAPPQPSPVSPPVDPTPAPAIQLAEPSRTPKSPAMRRPDSWPGARRHRLETEPLQL